MSVLFYSPGIRVIAEVADRGSLWDRLTDPDGGASFTIDISDDIVDGSLSLNQNAPHSLSLTLRNPGRKYESIFTPNDRIVVQMRRINWLQTFAGYLTEVPVFSANNKNVSLTAECTLKRLRYFPYDGGTEALMNLLNEPLGEEGGEAPEDEEDYRDGGMSQRAKALLTKVAGWPEEAIHIGNIPDVWVEKMERLYTKVSPEFGEANEILGTGFTGTTSAGPGSISGSASSSGSFVDRVAGGVIGQMQASVANTGGLSFQDVPDPLKGASNPQAVLRGHAHAAWQFIKQNWPRARLNSAWRGRGGTSDHDHGRAIDIGTTFGDPSTNAEARAYINSICLWFMQNPNAFGCKQIIWRWKGNRGTGWSTWAGIAPGTNRGGDDYEHIQHLHIGFVNENPGRVGPMGGAWPGATPSEIDPGGPVGASVNPIVIEGSGGTGDIPFVSATAWTASFQSDPVMSMSLTGPRLLMNDESSILPLIKQMLSISQRNFCSAPNGDFISWFPDYFGLYGTAGRIQLELIEVQDFSVVWSDDRLKTHMFVVGSRTGYGSPSASMEQSQAENYAISHGIASIEFPEILEAIMGIEPDDPIWGGAEKIMRRFGARPETHASSTSAIFTTPEMEFWAAIHHFAQNWASQFSSSIPLTFMPELFPGMLLEIPAYGFQAYVEQVTHRFSFGQGGGFSTSARIVAPSLTGGSKLIEGRATGGIAGMVKGRSDPDKMMTLAPNAFGTPQTKVDPE